MEAKKKTGKQKAQDRMNWSPRNSWPVRPGSTERCEECDGTKEDTERGRFRERKSCSETEDSDHDRLLRYKMDTIIISRP